MGQQQLLLIVLGTIIVGIAIVVGINMFSSGAVNAERDALIHDVNNIAALAGAYWRKPASLGGGERDWQTPAATLNEFGADSTNANGAFVWTALSPDSAEVTATGGSEGVIIVAGITPNGVAGTPSITLP